MKKLEIIDVYAKAQENKINGFNDKIKSTLNIKHNFLRTDANFYWLELMEDTIRYIDNILRNPNRFIVNEEDIVKIELARRITVESIKHLSKNTNFIQAIDEKTGDVTPSKILNINKDESYDTYENRLIYTLINNMKNFINLKKRDLENVSKMKDDKEFLYNASTNVNGEKVNISLNINSKLNSDNYVNNDGFTIDERIAKLELQIMDLTSSNVYKVLQKKRVAAVIPPIKKTNVILKNVNFQYAMKLWDFLQTHIDSKPITKKENKNYVEEGKIKQYMDDSFLLNYLVMNLIGKNDEETLENNERVVEEITNKLVDKIVDININMSEEKLKEMIGEKIILTRNKKQASIDEVKNTITDSIDKYLDKVNNFKFIKVG